MNAKILHEVSMSDVRITIENQHRPMIFYGALTPWWTAENRDLYKLPNGIPCDPRGGALFQTDMPEDFIRSAKENESHYGKHGLRAFLLAYHGCVVVASGEKAGYPTCLKNWDEYNELIDETYPQTSIEENEN